MTSSLIVTKGWVFCRPLVGFVRPGFCDFFSYEFPVNRSHFPFFFPQARSFFFFSWIFTLVECPYPHSDPGVQDPIPFFLSNFMVSTAGRSNVSSSLLVVFLRPSSRLPL